METWLQTTDAKLRAQINAELEALRKQVSEVENKIQSMHEYDVAMFNEKKAQVERALADLKAGQDKANADLKEGREKAKAEFK
jgi:DNA repair exonuclease SbcCD ATPase subunit